MTERVVTDTNVLVSGLLAAKSVPGRAMHKAIDTAQLLISDATFEELIEVLLRPKFDPYITPDERQAFFSLVDRVAERVPVNTVVRACRDSKDDKFLELAVSGNANLIVSGDKDLLVLHPFRGIDIVTPAQYMDK